MRIAAAEAVHPTYVPEARQKDFHGIAPVVTPQDPEASTMIKLACGGWGGGKSTACEWELIELAMTFPGGLSLCIRKSAKGRTEMSVEGDLKKIVIPRGWAKWVPGSDCFRWVNKHETYVVPADDWERFGSVDVTHWFIQEAQEIKSPEILPTLSARLRHPAGRRDGKLYYRGLMDARGVDNKHWLVNDFINNGWNFDRGSEVRMQAENPNWVYVKFKTADNDRNLPRGYRDRMTHEYKTEAQRKVFIEGEIGISVEGKPVFGSSFSHDQHVAEISEDPALPMLRGWDFGYRCPAVVWAQYTRSGRLLVLRELCPTDLSIHDLIREAQALQAREFPNRRSSGYVDYGDVAGDQVNSEGYRDIERVEEAFGTSVIGRKGDIAPGLDSIRKLMQDTVFVKGKNVPRFAVDVGCETLISAMMGSYYYESDKPKPVKGTTYAGVCDAVRYVAQQVVEEIPDQADAYRKMPESFASYSRLRY